MVEGKVMCKDYNYLKKLEKEIEVLKYIIKNTLWMSVRYSHGRHTYAPAIVRECISLLKNLYPNEQFLRPDKTIEPPSPEELENPMALRSDWLDDLLEDVNEEIPELRQPDMASFYAEKEVKQSNKEDLVDKQVDESVVDSVVDSVVNSSGGNNKEIQSAGVFKKKYFPKATKEKEEKEELEKIRKNRWRKI